MAIARDLDVVSVTLGELLAEVREIRRLLEDRPRPAPLSRADQLRLARILPAIAGAFGSDLFTSRDLPAEAGVRVVLRGLSIKQVGKLFSRGAGIPINGLVIERVGIEINVTLWRVVAVSTP